MAQIGIIGGGTWGIALASLVHKNGHQVTVWSAFEKDAEDLRKHRVQKNLPDLILPDDMEFTADMETALKNKDLVVTVVPSIYIRETAKKMAPFVRDGQIVVNASKGIESETLCLLSEILEEELPGADVAVLSGPSHAEEVSRSMPTTCVAGAKSRKTAEYIQSIFMSPFFRVYTSSDITGIEIGGALKNVIALAAGIADGLGYGDNTKAALITRGISEISRLGTAMGGKLETFGGLTGIGDLIVTCASMHSRNRRAGILIGKGYSMEEAMAEVKMVVEGVYSAKAGLALAKKYQISMPIITAVNEVLFDGRPAAEAVRDLMLRDRTVESPAIGWEDENISHPVSSAEICATEKR